MEELSSITDRNFARFQETADNFSEYRKHKVFQSFRSDLKTGYNGMSLVGDILKILKRSVLR